MESRNFGLLVLLIVGISNISAHNWLDTPVSRGNQRQSQTGCRVGGEGSPNCPGPCDRSLSQVSISPTAIQRGQSLDIKWNMHNHPGGFIRFAWCPTSQSDSHSCFDAHVQEFTCKQHGGCNSDNPLCSTTINAPSFLSDGSWTLQWAYFGGYFNAGDYYACVDYTVSGGTSVQSQGQVSFVGGDATYPNDNVCLFYSTNALHVCVNEPCTTGPYAGGVPQSGKPSGLNTTVSSPSTPTSPITTGIASPITTGITRPITTGLAQPITTGRVQPLTTGRVQSITTGRAQPITTGSVQSITTAAYISTPTVPSPSTTPASTPTSSCTSGYMKCLSDNTFSTCSWGSWAASQSCAPGTSCSASGNYIYCVTTSSVPISTPTPTPVVPAPSQTPVSASTSSSTSTSASVTPVPSTPSVPAPSASTSTSSSSSENQSCTLGNQRCAGQNNNAYQTCGNGRDGPTWYPAQPCQTGLSCHLSANLNNIYCY